MILAAARVERNIGHFLCNLIISAVFAIFSRIGGFFVLIANLYSIVMILPGIAVSVRHRKRLEVAAYCIYSYCWCILLIVLLAKEGGEMSESIYSDDKGKIIEYFIKPEGCLSKNMSDEEYMSLVRAKRDSLNLKQKAIGKIGLDEDQIKEIPPAMFEGVCF